MTRTEITTELQAIERDLIEFREQLDDTDDPHKTTRIRGVIAARVRRQEELELALSRALRAA